MFSMRATPHGLSMTNPSAERRSPSILVKGVFIKSTIESWFVRSGATLAAFDCTIASKPRTLLSLDHNIGLNRLGSPR
jgi:hypothetical protein